MLFRLAVRHLASRPRFFPVIALAIVIGSAIVVNCFINDLERRLIKDEVDLHFGHVKVYQKEYDVSACSLAKLIVSPEAVVEDLSAQKRMIGAAPRVRFRALLLNDSGDLPVIVNAIDSEQDDLVFRLQGKVAAGRYLAGSEEAAMLGRELAESLGLAIGDQIDLLAQGKNGVFHEFGLLVKGILVTGDKEIDGASVFISLDVAQAGLNLSDRVTEISLRLKDPAEAPFVKYEGLEVIPWQKDIKKTVWLERTRVYLSAGFLAALSLIVLIVSVNYFKLARIRRRQEYVYLSRLGFKSRDFLIMSAWELFFVVSLGIILGLLSGGVVLKCLGWL
ncbi:MAG: ABC transporter permease [Candidatus Margulisbacteria bacterium]|nr:ABC transporter permease [Candidatus Margulisiibacteriota bacterium]MBU1616747.1 ABC transporter permease [Candidatus Margulisiibacteriota bacterium]MBU1867487.1 ABC transporter permease [Candidatus Margulisiibacteriota bacterium]